MTEIETCVTILGQGNCGGVRCSGGCPAYRIGQQCEAAERGGFPQSLLWFENWLKEHEENKEPRIEDICAVCGKRSGLHRASDKACPVENGGYSVTGFQPKKESSRDALCAVCHER